MHASLSSPGSTGAIQETPTSNTGLPGRAGQ
jgi:hypothetical protein